MRAEEFVQLLRRAPFVPFRIHLTDGKAFDIRHPELVWVLRSRIDIAIPGNEALGILDRVEYCSLLHIVRIEDLSSATQAQATQ
ncbi:MAG: hypothetical protein ABR915_09955 [Thermoguttaceae bacterium]|jgi:hypothetical protein